LVLISEKRLYISTLALTNQTIAVSNYTFETPEFGLSDSGLHLLRSGYNFKTIDYCDIQEATLKRAVAVKNGLLVLAMGIALIVVAVYQAAHVYNLFTDPAAHTVYLESIVLPVLPLLLGNYCIYIALKKTTVLQVSHSGGRTRLSLKGIVDNRQAEQFVSFLQGKLGTRFQADDQEATCVSVANIS
jgi:nucleoid-associated protein YejK